MNEHVFALDIGTQSVTGILLEKSADTYEVIDFCVKQHKERAMLDGQIQDVIQVAEVIKEVKQTLEKNNGPLHKVCVAAAGRALKTVQTEKSIVIKDNPLTTAEEVRHLELSAVQVAQRLLTKENKHNFMHYHCVGFSVLHHKLDGEKIGSLIDQIGSEATVEIIATFLPKVVVESLLAALDRANLSMEALTLEPIAAIHVLIPESMRRLNIALIDIGAGTSDIAISNDGTVIAYGMVPVAGDEITETISDHYLLDFKIAETAKREIVNDRKTMIQDILGFETKITYEDFLPHITDRIDHLAKLLADEIRELNAKTPQAVMLIGGGSLTPMINERIANYLHLPKNRVAVRGIEAIQYLKKNSQLPTGPDFVTPIGIAISATQHPIQYLTVYVNNQTTLMFETKQLTVGDALIQAGIEVNQYYGKIGLSSIATVNGENMTLRGSYGKAPSIYVNDVVATVDSVIDSEDYITIFKGEDGKEPLVTIEHIVGKVQKIPFEYNGERFELHASYKVNDHYVDNNYVIQDKDNIVVHTPKTIEDFFQLNASSPMTNTKQFIVTVNGRKITINQGSPIVFVNDHKASLTHSIQKNDKISFVHPHKITVKTLLKQLNKQYSHRIEVTFNKQQVFLKQNQLIIKRNEKLLDINSELHEADELIINEDNIRPFIFQDVFRYVDITLPQTKGNYKLLKNGTPTSFHDEIIHGDQLEIIWD